MATMMIIAAAVIMVLARFSGMIMAVGSAIPHPGRSGGVRSCGYPPLSLPMPAMA